MEHCSDLQIAKLHSLSQWDSMNNLIKFISGVKQAAPPISLYDVATETIHLLGNGFVMAEAPAGAEGHLLEERTDILRTD